MKKPIKIAIIIIAVLILAALSILIPVLSCRKTEGNSDREKPTETTKTVITGADDTVITAGYNFDPYDGVKVTYDGKDITDTLRVKGSVNWGRAGDYTLTYIASAEGKEVTAGVRRVTVKANPIIDAVEQPVIYECEQAYCISTGCDAAAPYKDNNEPKNLTDNDKTTRWESPFTDEVTMTIDLGASLSVERLELYWEGANPKAYSISVSDGGGYTTVYSTDNYKVGGVHTQSIPLTDVSGRYFKFDFTKRQTGYGYSLFEVKAYGKKGTAIPYEIYPNAFESETIADEQTLTLDLGTEKEVSSIAVSWYDWLSAVNFDLYKGEGAAAEFVKSYVRASNLNDFGVISTRYLTLKFHTREFNSRAYRISQILVNGSQAVSAAASSEQSGYGAEKALGDYNTHWASAHDDSGNKIIDLGEVKDIGDVIIKWSNNTGKIYDLSVSSDGTNYTTVFRQLHGAIRTQTVRLYRRARYIRIYDYSNISTLRDQTESVTVTAQLPNVQGINYEIGELPSRYVIEAGGGSYTGGDMSFNSARLVAYLDPGLRDSPIPSNDWWQSLLINNLGSPLYLNPLRVAFKTSGLEIGNPGDGYFSGFSEDFTGGNPSQIVTDFNDLTVFNTAIDAKSMEAVVCGYSDFGIKVRLTDKSGLDKMMLWLNQGSPYIYISVMDSSATDITLGEAMEYFLIDGTPVLNAIGDSITTDALCVKVKTAAKIAAKGSERETLYEERYYIINAGEGSVFTASDKNKITLSSPLNYLSVGALPNINAAADFYAHGYALSYNTECNYSVDYETNTVTTQYKYNAVSMRDGFTDEPIVCLMPHHYKKSSDTLTDYYYKTVHGDYKARIGGTFETSDRFYGIVPNFIEPDNVEYSRNVTKGYIADIDASTAGNLMSGDPYWQGKNLHPLAMGVLAADQIGDFSMRDKFLTKMKIILSDWYTYSGEDDPYYFYYDDEWGTLYYLNSEFGANFNLADHHFTYGYYLLATAVVGMYDKEFYTEFKDMADILVRDYMNPSHTDSLFPYMRNYDVYAGHAWAGGYADSNGGNNQESAGEALNAWVGAYLYGQLSGDRTIIDAAVYGYTTELYAIKQYWFDYDGDIFGDYPMGAIGQFYGASNFYGTFFNGEPTYIYGIHWLPGGEFLSHYSLNERERAKMKEVYEAFLRENTIVKNNILAENPSREGEYNAFNENAWFHIIWPILSLYDPTAALGRLEAYADKLDKIEALNTYWFINAMASYNQKTDEVWASDCASAVVYKRGEGDYTAMAWNPTNETKTFVFRNEQGIVGSAVVGAQSYVKVNPMTNSVAADYIDSSQVNPSGEGGEESFNVNFTTSGYYEFSADVTSGSIEIKVDGKTLTLTPSANKARIILYGRYTLTVKCVGAFDNFSIVPLSLNEVAPKSAVASSVVGANHAENVLDGSTSTRWESAKIDEVTLTLTLEDPLEVCGIVIGWEQARAADYTVEVSSDGVNYVKACNGLSAGSEDRLLFSAARMRYLRINMTKRATAFGYSIYYVKVLAIGDVAPVPAQAYESFTLEKSGAFYEEKKLDFGESAMFTFSADIAGGTLKVTAGGQSYTLTPINNEFTLMLSGAQYVIFEGTDAAVTAGVFTKRVTQSLRGRATASSENGNNRAANAVDGNTGTRWESQTGSDDEWLVIDLEREVQICGLYILWEGARAAEYEIEVSNDGIDFTFHANGQVTGLTDETYFAAVTARYVRIKCLSRATDYGYSIYETAVYALQ